MKTKTTTTKKTATRKTKKPAEAKPSGMLAAVLEAAKDVETSGVIAAIEEATSVLGNQDAVKTFIDAVTLGDVIAANKLGFSNARIQESWEALDLAGYQRELAKWADTGDVGAKKVLAVLKAFDPEDKKNKVEIISHLWELMTRIVRPAQNIKTYGQLSELLRTLRASGLVTRYELRRIPDKRVDNAVILGLGKDAVGYLPNGVQLVETGWQWVKNAETRLIESKGERLAALKDEDTGLTAKEARAGKNGRVYFKVDDGAVLLQIQKYHGRIEFRIIKAVNVNVRTPTDWVEWTQPQPGWFLYEAFMNWKERSK